MFKRPKFPREVKRLHGKVRIRIEQRLDAWFVYAYVGGDIVQTSIGSKSEDEAQVVADEFENMLWEKGYR